MGGGLGRKTQIGRLRHRVRLEAPVEVPDEFNAPVQGWVAEADMVPAEVREESGTEVDQAGRVQEVVTHAVVLRADARVTTTKRLVWLDTGLVLNVVAVARQQGTGNWVEARCREAEAVREGV